VAVSVTKKHDPEIEGEMVAQDLSGTWVRETAAVVAGLCGPAVSFMVGHAMVVDTGRLAD
jgi:hypothetical protein